MKKQEDLKPDFAKASSGEAKKVDKVHQDCENRIKGLEDEVLKMKNAYLRTLADYKNLENRINNEREQMKDTIKKQIIDELLPVLDNLNQAEIFHDDVGLKMVAKSFKQALGNTGLEELDLLGTEYDPHFAEVVEVIPGKEDNIVIEVLQKPYTLNGHLVRHGRVKVSKLKTS